MGREAIKIPQIRSVYGDQIICDGGPFGVGRQGGVDPYYPVGDDCVLYHAYWDGTATDHSAQSNNGTVTGASFGEYGLTFDGNDNKVVSTGNVYIGASDWTIFIWAKPEENNAVMQWFMHGILNNFTMNYYHYDDNKMYVNVYDYLQVGGARYENRYNDSTTGYITLDSWQLISYVCDRDTNVWKCKNNTQNQSTSAVLDTQDYDPAPVIVGQGLGGVYPFKGIIGEVLIFTSLHDVTTYYNATKARYGL